MAAGLAVFVQCFKDQAAEKYTIHLKKNPEDHTVRLHRGVSYAILAGKATGAARDNLKRKSRDDFEKVLKEGNPCQKNIARSELEKDPAKQLRILQQNVRENPKDPQAFHHLGVCLFHTTTAIQEAVRAFEHCLELGKHHLEVFTRFYLGKLMMRETKFLVALDHLVDALAMEPNFTNAYIAQGECYQAMKEWSKAKGCFMRAKELNPGAANYDKLFSDLRAAKDRTGGAAAMRAPLVLKEEPGIRYSLPESKFGKMTFYKLRRFPARYYTTDLAGHAGSRFKVYEERSNYLEFKGSADEYGNVIEAKHESSKMPRIPKGDLKEIGRKK